MCLDLKILALKSIQDLPILNHNLNMQTKEAVIS